MTERFLRIERDEELAIWWLDQPGERHNKLSRAALEEISRAVAGAEMDATIKAIVVISAKPDSFVVGADVRELQSMTSRADAVALSRMGHDLIRRVRRLEKPMVAAIHGPAMGGGLELALSCTMRIATDHSATKFALPEVQLGLLPGGGGTQLLPRLIGIQQALPYLLTGKNAYPQPARRMGLIDALMHRPGLLSAAKQAARDLIRNGAPEKSSKSIPERLLESNPLTRRIIYAKALDRVRKATKGNYPAPPRIVECVREGIERGMEAGFRAEEEHFGDLAVSEESRELVRLFFAKNEAEKNPFEGGSRKVRRIGILGAGLMGRGIAEVTAENGIGVVVKDQSLELAAKARQHVYSSANQMLKKGAIREFERDAILERVSAVDNYDAFSSINMVIEAAPEDVELKRELIRDVEASAAISCIFASNTSSIPIAQLAEATSRPELVIGMHYFSPVPKVPLLEIVRTPKTPRWVLATAVDVGLAQGKTIIIVNDGPGFYTTRVLAVYMNEALNLLDDGADIDRVDRLMRQFGFPMGPYELFDLVGIDVAAKITSVLSDFFSEREIRPNTKAAHMVSAGMKGRKSERGFYVYDDGRRKNVDSDAYTYFRAASRVEMSDEIVIQRLVLSFANEAIHCLEDGIIESARDGDVGAVFGLGFPPFLGGPFRYVDLRGALTILRRLEQLRDKHGAQFSPSDMLREHARDDRAFT